MSKITLNDVTNLSNQTSSQTIINNNNDVVVAAIDNTLSRDGTSPNTMSASLDMNSNRILNLPGPVADQEPVRLIDISSGASISIAQGYLDAINAASAAAVTEVNEAADAALATLMVSITTYGAVGDGTTDNTTNVQAAFNSGASEIFIPAGVFLIQQITVPTTVRRVYGPGALKETGSDPGFHGLLKGTSLVNCIFEQFTIDIAPGTYTTIGIELVTCTNCVVRGCYFKNSGDYCVWFHGCVNCSTSLNRMENFSHGAILDGYTGGSTNSKHYNNYIIGNTSYTATINHYVDIENALGCTVFGNYIDTHGSGSTGFGINFLGSTRCLCQGNIVLNNHLEAIHGTSLCVGLSIIGNYCDWPDNASADFGMSFADDLSTGTSFNIIVADNYISNSGKTGIVVAGGYEIGSITGNLILNPNTLNGGSNGDGINLQGSNVLFWRIANNTIVDGNSKMKYGISETAGGSPACDYTSIYGNYIVGGLTGTYITTGAHTTLNQLETPSSGVLTNCTGLPIAGLVSSTSTALGLGTIELGHATDTTISRVSAGKIAVEGVNVVTTSSTDTLTNKTLNLTSNTLSGTTAQFNTALSDDDFATLTNSVTLTNKTLTSPTLTTPVLGTPSSGNLANCTALPVSGITASTVTALGVGSIELGAASDTTIARVSAGKISVEGVNVVTTSSTDTLTNKTLTSPTLTTPVLGTPSSGTLSSCTGYPTANLTGAGTGVLTLLATPSSANFAAACTDETGTGALVFGTSPTISTPNVVGTTAGGNATAGSVGEVISSTVNSGSAVPLTNNTGANVTSISLTAGDWDVYGSILFTGGASTTTSYVRGCIGTTSATLNVLPGNGSSCEVENLGQLGPFPTLTCGFCRINVSSTTPVYLIVDANFAVSTLSAYGIIQARRAR